MPIDPTIASGIRPVQLESPINQMANVYALQNAQQSNQLNQLKMDEYKRGVAQSEQRRNYLTSAKRDDPEFINNLAAIDPELAMKLETHMAGLNKEKALTSEAQFKTTIAKRDFDNQARRDLSFNSSNENIKAYAQNAVLKGIYSQEEAAQIEAQLLAIPENQRKSFLSGQGAKTSDLITKPSNLATLQKELNELPLKDPRRKAYEDAIRNETLNSELQTYETAVKQGFKGSLFDFKRQLAEAGRAPAQPAAPTITTIQDPTDPSKSINVDARVYKGGGLGSPGVIGTGIKEPVTGVNLSAKTIQQREAKYPTATASLKGHLTDTDSLVKDLTALSNHPGLDEITGLIGGRVPGATKNGRAAQALYDKIVARGGFNELQKMRDNSVTGGALGNVSDTEGKRLEAAFAGLDRRQDADNVKLAAKAAIEQLNASKANIQDAYDLTYEYKGSKSAPAKPTALAGKNPHANKTDAQIMEELRK